MTLVRTVDLVTKWYIIGGLCLLALWQIVLLVLRGRGYPVRLISMQMKDLGYGGLAAVVWFVSGLCSHWWMTWRKPVWSTPWPALSWWLIGAALLVVGLIWGQHLTQNQPRWSFFLWPPFLSVTSYFYAWIFFPQGGINWSP